MRTRLAIGVLILCAGASGCNLAALTADNLMHELRLSTEECREHKRNRELARSWWDDFTARTGQQFSHDYADGFIAGFADFLEAGGDGAPPPLPPDKYRTFKYETPQGLHAIEDWFAGFRAGAAAGRTSGYRNFVVLPVKVAPPAPPPNAADVAPGAPSVWPAHPPLEQAMPPALPREPATLPAPQRVEPPLAEPRQPSAADPSPARLSAEPESLTPVLMPRGLPATLPAPAPPANSVSTPPAPTTASNLPATEVVPAEPDLELPLLPPAVRILSVTEDKSP